ncbi:hypothetical protein [Gloeobacter kilaueensis]|uniref:Polyferredoxin n=1 Tax=Gloeobacter kilaueensis (strain ATCC BAA-2537 / CCAP 1431/1 / ULC 316 / JS1) TaxID=1183438 RepID=U5QCM0_GLOK1|nr:hypothetical protein [Gloeobacter kilaueensis]AGY56588.1 polyferredoxin [Gloeobacter kilaueensis JS1]
MNWILDRFRPHLRIAQLWVFVLALCGLMLLSLEPLAGPYGRYFSLVHPELTNRWMPLAPLATWMGVFSIVLFIFVGGYYPWRKLCPLAWFSGLPGRLGLKSTRSLRESWLERHRLDLQLALLAAGLLVRIVFVNANTYLLATAIVGFFVAAFAVNARYGGRTWCHYFCPLAPVETVFAAPQAEPAVRRPPAKNPDNSMCNRCSGCVLPCTDIDATRGLAKTSQQPAAIRFYYSYPGLVAGFYAWYYLHRGNWEYYFSAAWTREPDVLARLGGPGLFFLPQLPLFAAAALVLVAFMLASYALFAAIERVASTGQSERATALRPRLIAVANCLSINTFFVFAGVPVTRHLPWLHYGIWLVVLVLTSRRLYHSLKSPRPGNTYTSRLRTRLISA